MELVILVGVCWFANQLLDYEPNYKFWRSWGEVFRWEGCCVDARHPQKTSGKEEGCSHRDRALRWGNTPRTSCRRLASRLTRSNSLSAQMCRRRAAGKTVNAGRFSVAVARSCTFSGGY